MPTDLILEAVFNGEVVDLDPDDMLDSDLDPDDMLDSDIDTDDDGLNGSDIVTADSFDLSVGKSYSPMMVVSNSD